MSAFAGGSAPKIFGSNTGAGNGINIGQLIVRFDKQKTTTQTLQNETMAAIQKQFPEAVIVPRSLQTGPSVGKPVVIRVYGENITTLRELSQKIQEQVVKVEGISDVQDDLGIDRYSIAFETNQAMMERYRVTAADLSRTLRLVSEGIKVSEFDDGKQLTDITLYLQKDDFLFCHGTPFADDVYMLEEVSPFGSADKSVGTLTVELSSLEQNIIFCGHTHVPKSVSLPDGKLIVNPGSVGLPAYFEETPHPHTMESKSPHAKYVIVAPFDNSWRVEHVNLPYDFELAAKRAEENNRSDYAYAIRMRGLTRM